MADGDMTESVLPDNEQTLDPPSFEGPETFEAEDYGDGMPGDEQPVEGPPMPRPPQRPRRGRPRGPSRALPTRITNPDLEWDEWAGQYPWHTPGMKFILKRHKPPTFQGVVTQGVLAEQQNSFFTFTEVQTMYGGGEYEGVVVGPDDRYPGKNYTLSRRRLQIPGPPRIDNDAMPRDARYGAGEARRAPGHDTARALVDLVERQPAGLQHAYDRALKAVEESADARADAYVNSSRERITLAENTVKEEREAKLALERRVRELEEEMRQKAETAQQQVSEVLQTSQNTTLDALTKLLPAFTGTASHQVDTMAAEYRAREERIAASHEAQLQQLQQNHQHQLQMQRDIATQQIENLKAQFEVTLGMLKTELHTARAALEASQRDVGVLREALDRKTQELFTKLLEQKAGKNPMEQLTEMGALIQTIESLKETFGGGGAGTPEDPTAEIENPVVRSLMQMGQHVAPGLGALLSAKFAPNGQPGAAPAGQAPMLPPGYGPPAGYQPPPPVAPPALRSVPLPSPPPSSPTPAAPAKRRIKKSEMMEALQQLNNVLDASPEPPKASDLAQGLLRMVDHGMLQALLSKPPEEVLSQLEAQDMLNGKLATDEGKAYLRSLLVELAVLLPT